MKSIEKKQENIINYIILLANFYKNLKNIKKYLF